MNDVDKKKSYVFTGDWIFAEPNPSTQIKFLSRDEILKRNFLSFLLERKPHLCEIGKAFVEASGIFPIQNYYKSWISALNNLYDYRVSPEEVQSAVQEMRSKRLYISSPHSIINICLALRSKNKGEEVYY